MLSTVVGALIGGAIDGADGEDSNADGALVGAGVALVARAVLPMVVTYATGWLVWRGIGALRDKAFGGEGTKA